MKKYIDKYCSGKIVSVWNKSIENTKSLKYIKNCMAAEFTLSIIPKIKYWGQWN